MNHPSTRPTGQDLPLQKEKSCGALVYAFHEQTLQLLIIRHKMGGHWSFPKGHIERGETEHQTALREVREETGLHIQIIGDFRRQVTYSPKPGVSKDVVYFLGYTEDCRTVRQVEEISELRWVELAKASQFLTYENDQLLLSAAKEYLWRNRSRIPQGERMDATMR